MNVAGGALPGGRGSGGEENGVWGWRLGDEEVEGEEVGVLGLAVKGIDDVWWGWQQRTLVEEASDNETLFNPSTQIILCAKEFMDALHKEESLNLHHSYTVQVRWIAPSPGKVKLNTDGAVRGSAQSASAGGVVRDSNWDMACGFLFSHRFSTVIGRLTCLMFIVRLTGLLMADLAFKFPLGVAHFVQPHDGG
ncbi:hypothetical protein Tsubulata_030963 [Turnera subulata]|uniref:RNase H type-1 domain-containing protein n=1 Tax=Turnera subulata TaxID=218843 RepID=A0A9Q0G9W7_9ROSI|nr:hypothetical protein Tsubulata_030963 [Turnera subulata]